MTNPFFDTIKYPWYRKEADCFHKVLFNAIPAVADINTTYLKCGDGLPPLALGLPPDKIWMDALNNLATYSFLEKLCALVSDQFQNNNEIQKAIRDVINAQEASETRIFPNDVFFINRANLRDQLKLLEADENPVKVLIVRGGPKSGKSYSRLLFEWIATVRREHSVYICDGIVATVEEVIRAIFTTLKASDKIPVKDTTDEAWYRTVCFTLQEIASSKEQPVWIAVDDLGLDQDGAPLLDMKIRNFFEQFALNLVNPAFRKWFRLMLIHYPDGQIPTKWKREIWAEDRTSEGDVRKEHVAQFLLWWSDSHGKKVLEEHLTALADDVIAKAELQVNEKPGEYPRLQCIHDELTRTIKDLNKETP